MSTTARDLLVNQLRTESQGWAFVAHLSEQPWSNYTEADYTLEQWHAACLIHHHDGAPTSKSQCKLPVKTPNGALNRNGVHAAAAALAGARGGVNASADQKASAAAALRRYYGQLDENAPESLAHFGTKGMKWGVRRAQKRAVRKDAKWERKALSFDTALRLYNSAAGDANKDLPGINNKWKSVDLTKPGRDQDRYMKEVTDNFDMHLNRAANDRGLNPSGTRRVKATFDHDTGDIRLKMVDVAHADVSDEFIVSLTRDEFGRVINYFVEDGRGTPTPAIVQDDTKAVDFIEHYGTKGMKWGVRRRPSRRVSTDAARTARIQTKARTQGKSSLTNKELRDFNTRTDLQRKFSQANPTKVKKGHDFVKGALAAGATIGSIYALANAPWVKAATAKLVSNSGKKTVAEVAKKSAVRLARASNPYV